MPPLTVKSTLLTTILLQSALVMRVRLPAAETDAAAASMRVGLRRGTMATRFVPVHMEAFRHRVSWFHSQFAHGNAFRLVCGFHGDVAILVRIHVDRHFPGLGFD